MLGIDFFAIVAYNVRTLLKGSFYMQQIQKPIVALFLAFSLMGGVPTGVSQGKDALLASDDEPASTLERSVLVQDTSLLSITPHYVSRLPKDPIDVIVTAYSSTPGQTDDTPFTTAAQTQVREGVIAANFLPFGTKVVFPELYGNRVFVVEDRMHPRKKYQVDIWFPNYEQAKNFGAKATTIQVVEG